MANPIVHRVHQLNLSHLYPLVLESEAEGFQFVRRLYEDYASGINQFSCDGEALFAAEVSHRMIATCGLNQDPYVQSDNVGRVRRLYVHPDFRNMGIGKLLVATVIQEARQSYATLTLRTDNPVADKFYRGMGFLSASNHANTTHYVPL